MGSSDLNKRSYPYERLDGNHIRVLDLQPGSWKAAIHGHLRTVSREHADYEALSYVWGPRTQAKTMHLDENYQASVTDNLFLALRRLRTKRTIRTLWVDAICINQLDDIEKSVQVASMADTYREASLVNVWLGESPSARSIHLKCALAPHIRSYDRMLYTLCRLGRRCNILASDVTWLCQRLGSRCQTQDGVSNVEPWHTRVWTIQEFYLAQKIRFCIGSAQLVLKPKTFGLFESVWHEKSDILALRLGLSKEGLRITRQRATDSWGDGTRFSFTRMITKTLSSTLATDPRDMVYGILGILDEKIQQYIVPDYTLTYAEVCAAATAAALRASTIEVLAYVKLNDDESASRPSWAVDFAAKHRAIPLYVDYGLRRQVHITSFESKSLGLRGRILGIAVECHALLESDVESTLKRYVRTIYNVKGYDTLDLVKRFIILTEEICGCAHLVKLSGGIEVVAPGVVQAGDQLIRLCYKEPFKIPTPEAFVWLRPNGDFFLFRGLGFVLGETVYTGDYNDSLGSELMDDRTEIEKQAGFETFLVR